MLQDKASTNRANRPHQKNYSSAQGTEGGPQILHSGKNRAYFLENGRKPKETGGSQWKAGKTRWKGENACEN